MRMYENIPQLPDDKTASDLRECLENCEAIVKWAGNNIPEVNKANSIAYYHKLTPADAKTIALAYLLHGYVHHLNSNLEFAARLSNAVMFPQPPPAKKGAGV